MSETSGPLAEVLEIIAQLREQIADDTSLTDEQRAALRALLAYYLALTKQLEKHVDSLMHGE